MEFRRLEGSEEDLIRKMEILQDELIESEGKRGHVEGLFSELAKEAEDLEMKIKGYENQEENNSMEKEVGIYTLFLTSFDIK